MVASGKCPYRPDPAAENGLKRPGPAPPRGRSCPPFSTPDPFPRHGADARPRHHRRRAGRNFAGAGAGPCATSRCCCWKAAAWNSRPRPRSSMTAPRPASPISRWTRRGCAISAARPITGAAGAGRSTTDDFEKRALGGPFRLAVLAQGAGALFPARAGIGGGRAVSLRRAGPLRARRSARWCTLGTGGVYTSFFQFSQWAGNKQHLPTHFGERYAADLKRIGNLTGDAACQCHRPAAGEGRGPPRSSRRGDAVRQSFHGEAALHRAGGGRDRDRAPAARLRRRDDSRRRQSATISSAATSPTTPFRATPPRS